MRVFSSIVRVPSDELDRSWSFGKHLFHILGLSVLTQPVPAALICILDETADSEQKQISGAFGT
jgi:hypothetical protein